MLYKEASKLKLRFQTSVGLLSVDQLWDLNLSQLATIIKNIKKILKKNDDDELSFLDETTVIDTENQLRFDILKDVYLDKKSEIDKKKDERAIKMHNDKILALIAEKQDENLRNKSLEELEQMLKNNIFDKN
jgi:hypothetical protein